MGLQREGGLKVSPKWSLTPNLESCIAASELRHCIPTDPESVLILFWCAELAVLNQLFLVPYFRRLVKTGDFEEWKFTSIIVPILLVTSGLTMQLGYTSTLVLCTALIVIIDILVWFIRKKYWGQIPL